MRRSVHSSAHERDKCSEYLAPQAVCPLTKEHLEVFHDNWVTWNGHKEQDMLDWRDWGHKSAFTKDMGSTPWKPWKEQNDDSLERSQPSVL